MKGSIPSPQIIELEKFYSAVPHVKDMGMTVSDIAPGTATMGLPYRPEFLGDMERGLIHTAVTITLIDSACGLAVYTALEQPVPIATLDLRVDFLRPAVADKTLYAKADCFRLTRHIAFVRVLVYQDSPDNAVATSAGTFMLKSRRGKDAL